MNLIYTLALITSILLVSCGKQITRPKLFKYEDPTLVLAKEILYPANDSECLASSANTTNSNFNFYSQGRYQESSVDIEQFVTNSFIDHPIVNVVTHGNETLYKMKGDPGSSILVDKINISNSKQVSFCNTQSLKPNTIQEAALTVLKFSTMTYEKVDMHLRHQISPVHIELTPKEKYVFYDNHGPTQTMYRTDNAVYSPAEAKISFFPQGGHEGILGFSGVPLWKIPMVISHEYAHHVFAQVNSRLKNLKQHEHSVNQASQRRKITNDTVMLALNEGFADLMAYLTLPKQFLDLKGITCLEINRDVEQSLFSNLLPKSFSPHTLEQFFKSQNNVFLGCSSTNPQDIHTIGAIFAHQAKKLLDRLIPNQDQKVFVLLKWASELNPVGISTPEYLLKDSIYNFMRDVFTTAGLRIDEEQCSKLTEFPNIKLPEC